MVESPGSVRTMSAAPRAASVAPSTAIPTLARESAGASLAPSPVMALKGKKGENRSGREATMKSRNRDANEPEVTKSLNPLYNLELVLREDSGESIGVHDHLVERGVLSSSGGSVLENLSRVHVVSKSESSSGLLSDGELISSNHLDLDSEGLSVVDGLLGVVTGLERDCEGGGGTRSAQVCARRTKQKATHRVEDGEKSDKLESGSLSVLLLRVSDNLLEGDSESSKSSSGELLDVLLELVLHLGGLVPGAD
jgi:hypothetical protein